MALLGGTTLNCMTQAIAVVGSGSFIAGSLLALTFFGECSKNCNAFSQLFCGSNADEEDEGPEENPNEAKAVNNDSENEEDITVQFHLQ